MVSTLYSVSRRPRLGPAEIIVLCRTELFFEPSENINPLKKLVANHFFMIDPSPALNLLFVGKKFRESA